MNILQNKYKARYVTLTASPHYVIEQNKTAYRLNDIALDR